MGNAQAGGASNGPQMRNPFRPNNALGLTKAELDAKCKPSGLYKGCRWDDKLIRKLIGDGKLAARLTGHEKAAGMECPICFLHYSEANITNCCNSNICTECYLQVQQQKAKTVSCPFCNTPKLSVTVQQFSSQELPECPPTPPSCDPDLSDVAMSPQDRKSLENSIKVQHFHPLTLQIEQEEAERRLRNELNYYRAPSARISEERQLMMAIEASLRQESARED